MKRYIALLLCVLCVAALPFVSFAHSGGTDSNGGHYNHSTGEYHYHHGYSAHQHPNGVCPYGYNVFETTPEPSNTHNGAYSQYREYKEEQARLASMTPTPTLRPTPRPTPQLTPTPTLYNQKKSVTKSITPVPTTMPQQSKSSNPNVFTASMVLAACCVVIWITVAIWKKYGHEEHGSDKFYFGMGLLFFSGSLIGGLISGNGILLACGLISAVILALAGWADYRNEKKEQQAELMRLEKKKQDEERAKEREKYARLYENKNMRDLVNAPDGVIIAADGLPAVPCAKHWGEPYTVYVTTSGKCYHTKECRFVKYYGRAIHHLYARRYLDGCSYCKPPVIDYEWFFNLLEIKEKCDEYNIHVNNADLSELPTVDKSRENL